MPVTQKKFLDDVIAVCDKHSIPLLGLTRDQYREYGHHSEKTGYKLFNVKWREIITLAAKYVDGCYQPDITESVNNIHPITEREILPKTAMFDFDLETTLSDPENVRTSLNPPKVHPFKVKPGDIIFAVPDLHAPFFSRQWLVWVTQTIIDELQKGRTIHVIQLGDATDLYGLGNYEKNHNICPNVEIEAALKPIKQFWQIMTSAGAKCYQLIGNHDTRSEKYVRRHAPSLIGFVPIAKEMLKFPGVFTADNERDCLLFESHSDQTLVMHGYLNQSIDHVKKHGNNVIHSHLHRGGLNFFNGHFALDAGFGGDPKEWVFAYTNSILRKEWNLGLGKVEILANGHMQPHFLRYFG